jgi:hypothetical protein
MGKARTGNFLCSQASGECLYPVPKLNLESRIVIELLKTLRNQFNHVGTFSGEYRTGIPFSDVKIAAEFIGVRLNRKRINILQACVTAIKNDDITALNEKAKNK